MRFFCWVLGIQRSTSTRKWKVNLPGYDYITLVKLSQLSPLISNTAVSFALWIGDQITISIHLHQLQSIDTYHWTVMEEPVIFPLSEISLPYRTSADMKQASLFLLQKAESCLLFYLRVYRTHKIWKFYFRIWHGEELNIKYLIQ